MVVIGCKSSLEKGTEFSFDLPICAEKDHSEKTIPSLEKNPDSESTLKVIVADDSRACLNLLRDMIQSLSRQILKSNTFVTSKVSSEKLPKKALTS